MTARPDTDWDPGVVGFVAGGILGAATGASTTAVGSPGDTKAIVYGAIAVGLGERLEELSEVQVERLLGTAVAIGAGYTFSYFQGVGVLP